MNTAEHAQDNPYAAPQTPLQGADAHSEHWHTPQPRMNYYAIAFRITVVFSIVCAVLMGISMLMVGIERGEWKPFFAIAIVSIYVFMICLVVMMVLCSIVVGLDLILQHLGLRLPPAVQVTARRLQQVEPETLFFTELSLHSRRSQ